MDCEIVMKGKLSDKPLAFDINKTVKYWMDGAIYDLSVAEALYEKGKYPYALFMGHLAVEKLLKALGVKATKQHAPFTHSLSLLAQKSGLAFSQTTMKRLARFMEFHFEARYPEEQNKFYKKCTKQFTGKRLEEIMEVFNWLKKQF
ncbi:MAG TPA: HEPN domain-containing protein [Dissulfurispiraceae bacterium]